MLRDPQLAIALAIHEGACRMVAGQNYAPDYALKRSTEVMEKIMSVESGGRPVIEGINAEFSNARFYRSEHRSEQ